MCFFIDGMFDNNIRPKPMVAKKDFTVWKIIKKNGRGNFYNLYINGKFEPWTRGYLYYITGEPFKESFGLKFAIGGEAFHSYKSERHLKNMDEVYFNQKIVEMIIPKGAKYYTNQNGEVVSDQIIYPEI